VSILEKLYSKGSMILATTHYSEIKEFADLTPGFENGSMEFDLETLQPLYRLTIGKAGNSQAFSIAMKLGMDETVIQRAKAITYHKQTDYQHVDNRETIHLSTAEQENLFLLREKAISTIKKPAIKNTHTQTITENIFQIGDRVFVTSLKTAGIIQETENQQGEYRVLVNGEKVLIHKKRLKLHIESKMLYPDNYDMDIVFETKENRKKGKLMTKRHVEGLSIDRENQQ